MLSWLGQAVFADRSPIPETSGKVHKVANAAELDALLASTTHVVVDFYADLVSAVSRHCAHLLRPG